jgi:hypothetical protein
MSFTDKCGAEFSWDFQVETDDYAVAMETAVLCFWSALTRDEREEASETIQVVGGRILIFIKSGVKHLAQVNRFDGRRKVELLRGQRDTSLFTSPFNLLSRMLSGWPRY